MSIEATIFQTLKSLASNRVYQDITPPDVTALPRITYQQVGGQSVNFMDPTAPSLKNARFQVNVWGATRLQAAALSRQVEDALRTEVTLMTTVLAAPVAIYEPDTKLYGTMQDFSFWFA
jgi:hypothetical protein